MKSKRAREAAIETDDFLPVEDIPVEKKRKRNDDETGDDVKQKKAKKDKKDKKDKKKKDQKETRKEKKDKRKNLQDLPEDDAEEDETAETPAAEADEPKNEAHASNPSKSEKPYGDSKQVDEAAQAKKDKKKKAKEAKKEKKAAAAAAETSETQPGDENAEDSTQTGKNSRHIVFVGNLPFSATATTIKAHFASLNPISVRCLKNKDDPNPCRGIAFVEFANVWTMRTCLDKFHHTVFEDGVSAGRKVNVELTAGGGGGTKFRKDKIREKNKKLDENRSKRIEKERNAKIEGGGKKDGGDDYAQGGIHPSRLARNPRLGP